MDMGLKHKELVDKATSYLRELIPGATSISFEELGISMSMENPPNAAVVVLSFEDSTNKGDFPSLFAKKLKSIYLNPDTGELLAIKSKLA